MSNLESVIKNMSAADRMKVSGMLDDVEGCAKVYGVSKGAVMQALDAMSEVALNGIKTKSQMGTLVGKQMLSTGRISQANFDITTGVFEKIDARYEAAGRGALLAADFSLFSKLMAATQADRKESETDIVANVAA